jgi:hypothetical protein
VARSLLRLRGHVEKRGLGLLVQTEEHVLQVRVAVASVISYGYSNLKNVLFGLHQETEAQLLYATAQTQ